MTDPSSLHTVSVLTCIVRLFWLFIGNVVLCILACIMATNEPELLPASSGAYWLCTGGMLFSRYADIRYLNALASDGSPETMKHFFGYVRFSLIFSIPLWFAALLICFLVHH